jgi:hypothetical protein
VWIAALVLSSLIALGMVTSAGAGTTSVSEVSMTGRDASAGSTATSGGTGGTTTGGATIDWTVQYRNVTGAQPTSTSAT